MFRSSPPPPAAPSLIPGQEKSRLKVALWGILPVLMLLVVGVTVGRSLLHHDDEGADSGLLRQAEQSLVQRRFEEARIAALRLARHPQHAQAGALLEAKALQGLDRHSESEAILRRLAPLDKAGYAPAHVMLAVVAIAAQPPDFTLASRHLERALQAEPANHEAHELCARMAGGRKDWPAVIRHVDLARHEDRADLLLLKATALQASGQDKDAVILARKAEGRLRAMSAGAVETNLGVRYSLAISLSMQRKFQEAVNLVNHACQGNPSRQDRLAMADIYLAWGRHVKNLAGSDKMKAVEILADGIRTCAENQELMSAFLSACDEVLQTEEERVAYVRSVLVNGGVAKSFLHYYLGIQEWRRGSKATARDYFQLAHELNPGLDAITNNLALAIASVSDNPTDLEKALALMEPLLLAQPENPFFLDTRSHLYVRLGRLREAARDLEVALTKATDKSTIHGTLAGLYQKLGMNVLSSEHGALARSAQ